MPGQIPVHDAGEVASRLAVETACKEVQDGSQGEYDPRKLLEKAVQRANAEVIREGESRGSNMGTTLTLALIRQDRAYIASVGDSRAYLVRDSESHQLTDDHTWVNARVREGLLTPEQAANHSLRHVLDRALGTALTAP